MPQPSVAFQDLVIVFVQVPVVISAGDVIVGTLPHPSVADAVPNAASISDAAGLHALNVVFE